MRDRLIELIGAYDGDNDGDFADYLLENGVIVAPCVAMVEQVLKDGKMDRQKTLHYAGKYAVVYVDKSKWKIPLIDITEQFYNTEKAEERIQALSKLQASCGQVG